MAKFNDAVNEILEIIASKVPDEHLKYPLKAYVVGGVAINFYTNYRMSDDIDIQFERKIKDLPNDLFVTYLSEDNKYKELSLDGNYNDTLGLMQEDYQDRVNPYKTFGDKFEVKVIAPVDIVISKTLRFSSKDEEDIKELIKKGLVNKEDNSLLNSITNSIPTKEESEEAMGEFSKAKKPTKRLR